MSVPPSRQPDTPGPPRGRLDWRTGPSRGESSPPGSSSEIEPLDRTEVEARLAAAGISIGRARLRDIPAMARIQRQSFPPRLAYGPMTLLLLLLMPSTRCLNAYQNGEPVGTIIGDHYDGDARVVNLAVRPDARRHGVGAALLLSIEEELPDGDMVLMVQEENEGAHTLYRRAGYVDVGTAQNYYGRHRHGIWMRKHRSKRNAPTAKLPTIWP